MITVDELLESIFQGTRPSVYADFENWVRSSRRFRAFATTYQTKIRSKLQRADSEGSMLDLLAELETAALLLNDERLTLEYEKYAASKQRGPDFTVTYKTHTLFNVEVRRIRHAEWEQAEPTARTFKLATLLCEKLGQMPPGIVNLLWLASKEAITLTDLTLAVTTIRQLADRQDNDFLTRRGFTKSADFYKQYRRLSGVVLHNSGTNTVWQNTLAKHHILPEIMRAVTIAVSA